MFRVAKLHTSTPGSWRPIGQITFIYSISSSHFPFHFFGFVWVSCIAGCLEIRQVRKRISKRVSPSWAMTNANRNDVARSARNLAQWCVWANCASKSVRTRKSLRFPRSCASVAVFVWRYSYCVTNVNRVQNDNFLIWTFRIGFFPSTEVSIRCHHDHKCAEQFGEAHDASLLEELV